MSIAFCNTIVIYVHVKFWRVILFAAKVCEPCDKSLLVYMYENQKGVISYLITCIR